MTPMGPRLDARCQSALQVLTGRFSVEGQLKPVKADTTTSQGKEV